MNTNPTIRTAVALGVAAAWMATAGGARAQGPDARTVDALRAALDDERLAQATYTQVMQQFGTVRPFVNIVRAEARHEAMVLDLFRKYGLDIPQNRYTQAPPTVPATLGGAFRAAVQAEKENIALYDRFLAFVAEPDIRSVFQRLQAASRDNHLPAFQRGANRN